MFELPLLLADLQDVIKFMIPLVALVIWILSQVFGQKGAKPDVPPAGNARPQPGDGGLRQEIERFLREAQKQQQKDEPVRERELRLQSENKPGAAAAAEKSNKQERQRRKEEKQRELARQRARELAAASQRKPFATPEVIEAVEVVRPATSVADHVSSYMDSSKFGTSASHLGEQVGLADERLESHLQQAFSHQVGNLAGQPNEVERGGAAVVRQVVGGAQFAAMLRDPSLFRHAVVLNEILTRPEHRWD